MEDSFNPLDLLECDVVEEEGEVQIPDVNKDGTENKDGDGEISAEVEHFIPPYLQTPEPIFDLLHYTLYQPSPVADIDGSKNHVASVQEFVRPRLLSLLNPGRNVAFEVLTTAAPSSSVIQSVQTLPPLTAAPTALKIWSPSSIPTMPKLVPIPRPILSTSVAPPALAVNVWSPPMSPEIQPIPSTSVASSPPVIELEKDPLAIRPPNAALLCSHAETSFRCELQRYISKYSVTFFRLHCTSCGVHIKSTLYTVDGSFKLHKVLRVLVCQKCSEYYSNGFFPVEEGSEIYCFWCGNGGTLYCCSNCPKTFCKSCIIRNFGFETYRNIAEKETWMCFVCDFYLQGKQLWAHRVIPGLLQKHIKQLRSEATRLEGDDKTRALNEDFSLCCIKNEVTQTIEVTIPFYLYSKIPQHLISKQYKLVCKPGTEPAQIKQPLVIAEETRPGYVSVGQKSGILKHRLMEVNVPMIDLTRGSSLAPPSSENTKWLSKVLSESEQFINDFKLRLSYCNVHSKNMSNLSVNCVISNLESLFKTAIGSMKKICNNIEQEKKRTLQGSKSHVATTTDTKEASNLSEVNTTDSSGVEVEPPLLSEPQVLQTENKENQFNENNVDASLKSVDSSKVKVNSPKKNQSSPVKFLTRKRKLEMCDKNAVTDYKYLFKKYKLKNCNVVLKRTDFTSMYNLKKCNVVLKRSDFTYK